MQRIVAICESTGVPFRTVPKLSDILQGQSLPGQLKEVAIEDLLGRKPIMPDWNLIRGWLGGRTVMVTGAGGSIGSELCRQCARHGAGRIILLEISELLLLTIEGELRRSFPDVEVEAVLGDCGDPAVIRHALSLHPVDTAFHAAAYKHVPVLERQLREAVRNNIRPLRTWPAPARSARRALRVHFHRQGRRPGQCAGRQQALCGNDLPEPDQKSTHSRFVTVRFGNVLASAGSVVPLFREQILRVGR